mmetsp:Transcript_27957/g.41293  ORF Transcript_27957/g.41293 Transcript_27957/m.41293 type:complete len:597 (-) Transcript_27957:151-1941(-)
MVFGCGSAATEQVVLEVDEIDSDMAFFQPDKKRVESMVIVGHTTTTQVRLWCCIHSSVQENQENSYNLVLIQESGKRCWDSGDFMSPKKAMPTLTFDISGLIENTKYRYQLLLNRTKAMEEGTFRTSKTSYSSLTIAAYSCHDPYSWVKDKVVFGAWPEFERRVKEGGDIDLTLGMGDQMYVDCNEMNFTNLWSWLKAHLSALKKKFANKSEDDEDNLQQFLLRLMHQYYLVYWNVPSMKAVLGNVPGYMMWDDHEISDGWGSFTFEEQVEHLESVKSHVDADDFTKDVVKCLFIAAATAYNEFQHSHNPYGAKFTGREENLKSYAFDYQFRKGAEYDFFVMDMRGHHDSTKGHDRLLGQDQMDRFEAWLQRGISPSAKNAIIVSPVPLIHWSPFVSKVLPKIQRKYLDDLMDGWEHPTNHEARNRLLNDLLAKSHELELPIVILSGDVHCPSVFVITDPTRFPNARILQITSSSISRKPVPPFGYYTIAGTGNLTTVDLKNKTHTKSTVHHQFIWGKAGVNNFCTVSFGKRGIDIETTFHMVKSMTGETTTKTLNLQPYLEITSSKKPVVKFARVPSELTNDDKNTGDVSVCSSC